MCPDLAPFPRLIILLKVSVEKRNKSFIRTFQSYYIVSAYTITNSVCVCIYETMVVYVYGRKYFGICVMILRNFGTIFSYRSDKCGPD